ncbi:AP superfamily protein [Halapricum desulfuricans]|uniref:AP superfamily protein n=1 Tax=Halapricum desulfuricans TaxID=2841257 RepID=A0A897NKJ1_9EURY|nr:hypothetical protein [Halapricum desulfuricans]QSG11389.1 AP superfamily protein [Halapricum desulfuricans]
MATFETIAERAKEKPIISELPPLASFYLDEFGIYRSLEEFHRDLYDPDYFFERDVILETDDRHPDYPRIDCTADPFTPALDEVVEWDNREHHDRIRQDLLRQSNLKEYILDTVTTEDFVALVIVDGLSYESVRSFDIDVQPVIVDGITITEPGFRRIIYGGDKMSVYAALTDKEFYNVYGFTYWNRGQEDLSTDLHSAMGKNVHRINDFDQVLTQLKDDQPFHEKTFVQITRMGFDQDSHNRKEEPNYGAIRDSLSADLKKFADVAAGIADDFRIFVTSDHGILWRDHLPNDPPVVCDDWKNHARFVEGDKDVTHGMVEQDAGETATGLAYPYLTRELKNTEWGVHGGFSYHESVVPLIEISNTGDLA